MAINKLLGLFINRMEYNTQRQGLIAQNIASSNIPGYKPKDLSSFESVLKNKMGAPAAGMQLTNAKHISGTATSTGPFKVSTAKDLYEVKPSGNAVVTEQEMTKLAETNSDYAMIAGLYKKMVGLLKSSVGARG